MMEFACENDIDYAGRKTKISFREKLRGEAKSRLILLVGNKIMQSFLS